MKGSNPMPTFPKPELYAFPRPLPEIELPPDEALRCIEEHAGMTLRDYFAAKAMQGLQAGAWDEFTDEQMAERSYRVADAMLCARESA